jgi:hypothetical protein
MQRLLVTAAVLAFSLSAVGAGSAVAAPCKDMHGKFIKCPPMKPMRPMRCKDVHGKFMKCGMPGARPF